MSFKISHVAVAVGLLSIRALTQPAFAADDSWGPESDGIRCRLVAVPTEMEDERPEMSQQEKAYSRGGDVAFAVELKNFGDKPATLLGVRYGDSYGSASGRLATATYGPHLFEFDFTDADGKPIPRSKRAYLESSLHLSGASAHELTAGKSLVVLLRPSVFNSPMDYQLPPGSYRTTVRYRGPAQEVLDKIKQHWPDKPQAKAWSGSVTSNQVAFTVENDPNAQQPRPLQWGQPEAGLQAAVEFRPQFSDGFVVDPRDPVPLNTKLAVVFHLQNVGKQPISLVSETWRQGDRLTLTDEAGLETELRGGWYSGWPVMVRWSLEPGETAEVHAADVAVVADQAAAEKLEHPIGIRFVAKPGAYSCRYTIRIGGIQTRDADDNVVIPGPADWTGSLVTGQTPLEVRERTPEDDARERAQYFVGRVEFVGTDGKAIENGALTARTASQQGKSEPIEIHAGPVEIPDCSAKSMTINVRARGYEETRFEYVELKRSEIKRFELTPAEPTQFRLVSAADGSPIGGTLVRYFNRSFEGAGGNPFPTDGLQGPVWAISAPDGSVQLDSLKKFYSDQRDARAVYFFYIEDADFAGHFLARVKAGEDLGDIELHFPMEVRGEIQGTPEELSRFAAEWDQPLDMRNSDNADSSLFAVSQRLETKRVGDKLTFHLTGLRPGKLRFISNFGPRPHTVKHIYGRRDPQEGNVVAEFDLTESTADLILTPRGKGDGVEVSEP